MENIITLSFPSDNREKSENKPTSDNLPEQDKQAPAVPITEPSPEEKTEDKYDHIRSPELKLGGTKLLMTAAAVCGLIAGAAAVIGGQADCGLIINSTKTTEFGEAFLRRCLTGGGILLGEYIMGYFAAGDWLVWILPLLLGMGVGLWFAAAGSWLLLPGAAAVMIAAVYGASESSEFSLNLRRLTHCGTVYQDSSPSVSYALHFASCAAAVLASALYEGLITVLVS